MSKVSVVMPVYNTAPYLAEAVNSIIEQSFKDWELIVIDDCSTDSTPVLMRYFCDKDPRVKYFKNERNMGISFSRNRGISESCSDVIAVMDSDDVASPDRLKKSLKALKNVDCVYTSYLQANENGKVFGVTEPEPPTKLNWEGIMKYQMIPHVTMVGKKELFKYKDEYRTNDDLYLVCKMFSDGVKFKKIREPLMIVRYHDKSTSQTKDKNVKEVTEKIRKEFIG
jgi:teichuronic acid biosynthesis glycosyltransferase TuaG